MYLCLESTIYENGVFEKLWMIVQNIKTIRKAKTIKFNDPSLSFLLNLKTFWDILHNREL